MDSVPTPVFVEPVVASVHSAGPKDSKEGFFQPAVNPRDEETSDTVSVSIKPNSTQEAKQNGDGNDLNSITQESVSGSNKAPLYCSIKGRSHGTLLEWGIASCPICKINLSPTAPPRTVNQQTSLQQAKEPDHIRDLNETKPNSRIEYKIKYLDSKGKSLGMDPWDGPLDLEAEMSRLGAATPILEVLTLLQTDISDDSSRDSARRRADVLNRKIIGNKDFDVELVGTAIKINSRPFIHALQKLVPYWPDTNLVVNSGVEIIEPYPILIHQLDSLEAYKNTYPGGEDRESFRDHPVHKRTDIEPCTQETYEHINVITSYLQPYQEQSIRDERKGYEQTPAIATFAMLWLLIKPGMTVYAEFDGSSAAFVVSEVKLEPTVLKNRGAYHIKLWYLDFDGRHVGRREHNAIILPFDGTREVTSLSVYPCEFKDITDGGALRKRLEDRGVLWYKILLGAQMEYSGEVLGENNQWYQGRVMIDNAAFYDNFTPDANQRYLQKHAGPQRGERGYKEYTFNLMMRPTLGELQDSEDVSRCRCIDCRENPQRNRNSNFLWSKYDNIDPKRTESLNLEDPATGEITRHRYLLCPKRVMGFLLTKRKFEPLNVECCSTPQIKTRAIENLVMPPDRLTLIKALVKKYTDNGSLTGKGRAKPWTADFIENKGEGQIFLLHGSPGVGKTYTAECISESTGRPLLSLTVGNIGTNEARMEENLSKWFRLAEGWGAVMLVDEADIFLEKRVITDINRNSLVSIFLRTVEYYRGILFLTTNRVGHFDDAFISRIHIVIHYENFNDEYRRKVWTQFFDKLESERRKEIGVSRSAKNYVLHDPEMQRIPWNGREIRNAFQTAVALAEYRFAELEDKEEGDKALLEREDFEKVCEMTGSFKKYLTSVSAGADESGRARTEGARDDNFREY